MVPFILYAFLGLLFGGSGCMTGVNKGAKFTDLGHLDVMAINRYGLAWPLFQLPMIISTVLLEIIIMSLIAVNIIKSGWIAIFWCIVFVVFGVLLGIIVHYFAAKIYFVKHSNAKVLVLKERDKIEESKKRKEIEKRKRGVSGTKVYRCAICGEVDSNQNYAKTPDGVVVCTKHTDLLSSIGDEYYQCPFCGYKFAIDYNREYSKNKQCANCKRKLDNSVWK